MATDKIHSHEPLTKRNLRVLKDCANEDRELTLTAFADVTTIRTLMTVGRTAVRAYNSTITPTQKSYGIANDRKTTTTIGSNHNGCTYQHALATILNNAVHDDQHHRCRRQIIQIG